MRPGKHSAFVGRFDLLPAFFAVRFIQHFLVVIANDIGKCGALNGLDDLVRKRAVPDRITEI